jgi:hypothetical protein
MKATSSRLLAAAVCLGLLLALPVVGAAARTGTADSPSSPGRWLPFDGISPPAEPGLALVSADTWIIEVQATLPGAWFEEIKADGQTYTRLLGDGYGHPAVVGRPDLPVLRGDIEIPFGAEVTVEVVGANFSEHSLADLGIQSIYPLQPPVPKVEGARENQPFAIDSDFYDDGASYPATPLALADSYVVRGHRVQTVEVWPVTYDPTAGTVRLYSQISFRLNLTGSDLELTESLAERYASPAFESRLARQVLNYNQGQPERQFGESGGGYLIIVGDAYYDAIQPFAMLKESRGFEVTTTRVSDIPGGGSNSAIKAYIQEAYDTWPTPPSYVLLVGDTNTIPGWDSVSASEVTDLYYATMDGSADWHPDIGRGRFPVRSAAQTTTMVDKYLTYAGFTGAEPWLKKAAFIASCDDYQTAEGTHNYVIDSYTRPNGYTGIFPNNPEPGGDKIYCVTYGGSSTNITNGANDGRWAIIYSGHGSTGGWGDGAVSYSQADVNNLNDYGFYPFVGSHACQTGNYAVAEAYCETWVLQEGKGALVFWGSSDYSYWDEDDWLERGMFDELFAEVKAHADVTDMTYFGLAHVEEMSPGMARYYWETYNVMGDPAVKIFIEPDMPTFTLSVDPAQHEMCSQGSIYSTVEIGSILGYSEVVYLDTEPPPAGISAAFDPASAPAPYSSEMTLAVAPGTPAGDYEIVVVATDNVDITLNTSVFLDVVQASPAAPALLAPPDGAMDQPFAPAFEWSTTPFASSYNYQLDTSPLFEAPLLDVGDLPDPTFTPGNPLEGGTCYWWHAQGYNACGAGEWAAPFHFATVALDVGFFDNMEAGGGQWTHAAAQGSDHWAISTAQSHSPTHAWFVPDDAVITDSRLWNIAAVPVGAGSTLTFWHQHQFESSYDGAVLEISTNGGATWTDLGPHITANGYNGTISSAYGNPLGGRQGWVSDLNTWTQVEVDVSSFAGQDALVRWRLGCDSSVSDVGWYIDDVQITSPLPPNPAPVVTVITPDSGPSDAPTPVQIAGTGFLETPAVRLGETWLLDVTWVSPSQLTAVVPAGMEPGMYDLMLFNGDCQEASLPDAFTITGEPGNTLHVDRIKIRYLERLPGKYVVQGALRILDQDGQAVANALVTAEWTLPNGATTTQQVLTTLQGLARFRIKSTQTGNHEMCVTDVTKAGYTYDPDQNNETCKTIQIP